MDSQTVFEREWMCDKNFMHKWTHAFRGQTSMYDKSASSQNESCTETKTAKVMRMTVEISSYLCKNKYHLYSIIR